MFLKIVLERHMLFNITNAEHWCNASDFWARVDEINQTQAEWRASDRLRCVESGGGLWRGAGDAVE